MSDFNTRDYETGYKDGLRSAEATIAALRDENSSLSAWQCVYTDGKAGLVGDEHGNQYCAMAKRVEALRAEVERLEGEALFNAISVLPEKDAEYAALRAENEKLRAALKWLADKYDEAMPMRTADLHIPDCTCMRCARDNARAALEGPRDRMAKPLGESHD